MYRGNLRATGDPVVDYMVKTFGPRIYTIAADYNFGQLTAAWTKATAPLVGGEIIEEEFVPLSVSDFSTSIARIQQQNLIGSSHPCRIKPVELLSTGFSCRT